MTNEERAARAEALAKVSIYKKNSASFSLGLLAALLEAVYVLQALDQMERGVMMGAVVAVNIVLLFGIFTAAIKMNVYAKEWAYISLGASAYMLVRVAVLLPKCVRPMGKVTLLNMLTLATAAALLAAGIVCWRKHDRRQAYLNT